MKITTLLLSLLLATSASAETVKITAYTSVSLLLDAGRLEPDAGLADSSEWALDLVNKTTGEVITLDEISGNPMYHSLSLRNSVVVNVDDTNTVWSLRLRELDLLFDDTVELKEFSIDISKQTETVGEMPLFGYEIRIERID